MLADVGMPSLQGLRVIRLGIDFQLPGMILLSMMTWTVPATGPMEMPGLPNGAGCSGESDVVGNRLILGLKSR